MSKLRKFQHVVKLIAVFILFGTFVKSERVCTVLAGIDEPLFNHYDKNMSFLTHLVETHFDGVNEIFQNNNTGPFRDSYSDVKFKLGRVQVMFGSCASFKYENCTENRSKYLEIFDQYDFREFCLAYMFTYLDFHNGTSGLASLGTLCRPRQNSGFVTLLNYGEERPVNESILTLAHELGHSLGANHDGEIEDRDCGSSFIMAATTNSSDPVTMEFSNCSLTDIRAKLDEVTGDAGLNCLVEDDLLPLEVSVCGNMVLEPGEECDCGETELECDDPCCYPAIISPGERSANDSALSCSRAARSRCVTPPELFYGIYLPLLFIFTVTVLVSVFLRHDWTRDKSLFTHITEGNIRIVTSKSRRASNTEQGSRGEQSTFK